MPFLLVHRPKSLFLSLSYDIGLISLGFLLLSVSARIMLPLPFTPVPITAQTLALFLIASSLGKLRGTLVVFSYIIGGVLGLPVFAGGAPGISRILGPTGGYIIGFLLAIYVMGFMVEMGTLKHLSTALITFLIGNMLIYIPGIIHLSLFTGWDKALQTGLYPFILGDVAKILVAGISVSTLRKMKHLILNWRGKL